MLTVVAWFQAGAAAPRGLECRQKGRAGRGRLQPAIIHRVATRVPRGVSVLEVVYGEPRNRPLALQLADVVNQVVPEGTIYLGYPVLATVDEVVVVDALLVAEACGIVAFQIGDVQPQAQADWDEIISSQDRLYNVLESNLRRHDSLRRGRQLVVVPHTITVFGSVVQPPPEARDGEYCSVDEVGSLVRGFAAISAEELRALQGAIQHVSTIKPAKRRVSATKPGSRGTVMKDVEKGIANLDRWQRQAAIETPDGPQRIRGLAGSGKTIVLALKAAYLHVQHPDWTIAVTFQSRALYQQFEDLITRFTFDQSNDRPDFERVRLLHAWGSPARDGVYNSIARHVGAPVRDWNYALNAYGRDDAFQGVCGELLAHAESQPEDALFDAVLIDEAQDLPPEFFKLVWRFTRAPRRVAWAYDELQRLSEAAMPSTDELFGVDATGGSRVTLVSGLGEPRRDITLPICYRNSPWALATAHALGLGVYREGGLIQHFDDPALWLDIGYRIVSGTLQEGARVELERATQSTPSYFAEQLTPTDSVYVSAFQDQAAQDEWVADQILRNITADELEADDILVVLPEVRTSKQRASQLARALDRYGLSSHLVGVTASTDQMFVKDSIAMAHIHRAKGNEAPMVYVLDSQFVTGQFSAVTRRNTLFTAITRSRAWVRICGWGDAMPIVARECEEVAQAGYHLKFQVPTFAELARLRRLHRDRSDSEVASIDKVRDTMQLMFEMLDRGQLDVEDIPESMRNRLSELGRDSARRED
jgi:superfamily I DNA and RNA helicase